MSLSKKKHQRLCRAKTVNLSTCFCLILLWVWQLRFLVQTLIEQSTGEQKRRSLEWTVDLCIFFIQFKQEVLQSILKNLKVTNIMNITTLWNETWVERISQIIDNINCIGSVIIRHYSFKAQKSTNTNVNCVLIFSWPNM